MTSNTCCKCGFRRSEMHDSEQDKWLEDEGRGVVTCAWCQLDENEPIDPIQLGIVMMNGSIVTTKSRSAQG